MAEILFLISAGLMAYAFTGYPVILRLMTIFAKWKSVPSEDHLPLVSIILSVFNEEQVIRQKLENFLSLDYPEEKLELIVVSDGSTDQTEDIVRSYQSEHIRLVVQQQRGGKTLALNRGVEESQGEVLVFTDANSMYDEMAVKKLVRHFAQPEVGLVSGCSVYLGRDDKSESSGGAYRKYEDFIKKQESSTVSIVGADGAIYALRRELYEPLPSEHINDLIHPIQVVIQGFRAVHEPGAKCMETLDSDAAGELRRQTRIMAQSWLIVFSQAGKLFKAGSLAHLWALFSHKVLRWLTLPLMAVLLGSSLWLAGSGHFYQLILAAQLGFYLLAVLGWKRDQGMLKIPAMFILLHAAAMLGLFKLVTGQAYVTWDPRKS